jgi:hypothetical protein
MKISRSAEVIVARTECNAQWATDLMPFENHWQCVLQPALSCFISCTAFMSLWTASDRDKTDSCTWNSCNFVDLCNYRTSFPIVFFISWRTTDDRDDRFLYGELCWFVQVQDQQRMGNIAAKPMLFELLHTFGVQYFLQQNILSKYCKWVPYLV